MITSTCRVDLDYLCQQESYITHINQFLVEEKSEKALEYWLENFVDLDQLTSRENIISSLQRSISTIDNLINDQLNLVIHHSKLQKLEASWRGLWFLCTRLENTRNIKIKVLDIHWSEIVKDICRALEFDQSQLFQKIYTDEYGSPGGEPYGVLIGDYEIHHCSSKKHPFDDIATLEGLAQISAASFAPFIASTSSELFGLDTFSGLGMPLDFKNIFSQQNYIKWHSFRENPDSKFIGLALPRILMRLPYQTRHDSYKGFFFYEKQGSTEHENYLWGNAAYAFAGILIREFSNVGWFGHIRGVPRNQTGGGLVDTLLVDTFPGDSTETSRKPVTDILITDRIEKELSELGLMPLCQCYDTPFAAFYNNRSVHKIKSNNQNSNAELSVMLQNILCGSRIAHYIKIIMRDKVGSFVTTAECENYLSTWLFKYTTGREDLEWEEQAKYPLREAAVDVKEHPEKPGQYLCIIHLKPHYQLDNMVSELELSTELTQTI